jgi:hypothetical protein
LEAFWEEEIDESGTMINSKQKRPMIPRKKIRAYLADVHGNILDLSQNIEVSRTIHRVYSGYVHGASPQIMDMYGGDPPHFHTKGMLGTPRMEVYTDDFWNYIYRTFVSHIVVASVFGAAEFTEILNEQKSRFEDNARNKL